VKEELRESQHEKDRYSCAFSREKERTSVKRHQGLLMTARGKARYTIIKKGKADEHQSSPPP